MSCLSVKIMVVLGTGMLSVLGAFLVRKYADNLQLMDTPNHRSSHIKPTPRCGGIGIWVGSVAVAVFFLQDIMLSVAIGGIGLIGFWVDWKGVYYRTRLLLEFIIAGVCLFYLISGPLSLFYLCLFVLFSIFIVGTTNLYNFMDGINGMATITGMIAFGLLAFFCNFIVLDKNMFLLSIALISGCFFFLPWNFPKAKVFMGDVASLLLGFIFAIIVMKISTSFLNFLCGISFLFPFYADEIITMFIRWRNGEDLIQSHRKHFYQILANEYNISHWKISVFYGVVQLLIGVLSIVLRSYGIISVSAMLLMFFLVFVLFNIKIRRNVKGFQF